MKGLLTAITSFLGLVASTGASTCSVLIYYEPEIPESLKK